MSLFYTLLTAIYVTHSLVGHVMMVKCKIDSYLTCNIKTTLCVVHNANHNSVVVNVSYRYYVTNHSICR